MSALSVDKSTCCVVITSFRFVVLGVVDGVVVDVLSVVTVVGTLEVDTSVCDVAGAHVIDIEKSSVK